MANRLKLDFSIESSIDRNNFLQEYLSSQQFKDKPLTKAEMETCANYVLWGKDADGKNVVQRKEIQIETKNKTWDTKQEEESLDGLMETPTFNENCILAPTAARYKVVKETFSREKALKEAPDYLQEEFKRLFRDIDRTELTLNFYDLKTGKRKNPPREELLKKFTEEEINDFKDRAEKLNQYTYLRLRHYLVELRREQYTLKDSYSFHIQKETTNKNAPEEIVKPTFDVEIPVYPLGLFTEQQIAKLIFKPFDNIIPTSYTEKDLEKVSKYYWNREIEQTDRFFDFRDMEHVYQLFLQYFDLKEVLMDPKVDSTTHHLFKTLEFYIEMAQLTELQQEILQLKIEKVKNQDIAAHINKKYGKSYTANYISTLFRQKIIKQINDAAVFHDKLIQNIYFPEEFKQCNTCGKTLLRCTENFVKKSRSKDGLTNRCKECDKKDRLLKKQEAL